VQTFSATLSLEKGPGEKEKKHKRRDTCENTHSFQKQIKNRISKK